MIASSYFPLYSDASAANLIIFLEIFFPNNSSIFPGYFNNLLKFIFLKVTLFSFPNRSSNSLDSKIKSLIHCSFSGSRIKEK